MLSARTRPTRRSMRIQTADILLPLHAGKERVELLAVPDEFNTPLYGDDLILNVAHKIKEAVQKLKFLDSPPMSGLSEIIVLQYRFV